MSQTESLYSTQSIAGQVIGVHVVAFVLLLFAKKIKWETWLFQVLIYVLSAFAITAGYHRYFTHKSYDASPLLEWFYVIFGVISYNGDALNWVRSHRAHHTNEDKPGDPYNISKGFYNAHLGWMLRDLDEHESAAVKGIDMRDLESKPAVMFQARYFTYLLLIFTIILIALPVYGWKETWINSTTAFAWRVLILLHSVWCVNSLAHYTGDKPYNPDLEAKQNAFVSFLTLGEGWHNYHHAYPKDYKASEAHQFNPTTYFILLTKWFGMSSNHHYREKHIQNHQKFDLTQYKTF
jgi:stearoyl-CoA desaturase (delta-9 desaturase)